VEVLQNIIYHELLTYPPQFGETNLPGLVEKIKKRDK